LTINFKKSGLLVNGRMSQNLGKEYEGFPLVVNYRYLGVTIDKRLTIKEQRKAIKRVVYLYTKRFFKIRTTGIITLIKKQI
jgi:hypothetical protein